MPHEAGTEKRPPAGARAARRRPRGLLAGLAASLLATGAAGADPAPFDLQGPGLDVKVAHAGQTLPIAEVPNLAPGDRVAIRADLPDGEAGRYLVVVAFLRGAVDPPPKSWFYRVETRGKPAGKGKAAGPAATEITAPAGAKQAVVLLAPKTGGDFDALVSAVRSRPGVFVRASQDLNQASRDRARLDAYLAELGALDRADPAELKTVAPLLARSLVIKLDDACFTRMPELQAACLTEGRETLVLGDPADTSLVKSLTSGPSADLATQISDSPGARFGYYSAYVGAAIDLVRILSSFRTAHFQYIPAVATAKDARLSLFLNSAPSFQDPKSVLVAALPPIDAAEPPPALRAVDPKAAYCAYKPDLVLPVEGAPLVYATRFAHDLVLRIRLPDGKSIDAPLRADAEKGGFVVDTSALKATSFGAAGAEAVIHGAWGFAAFDGPRFSLHGEHGRAWTLSSADRQSVIAGRDATVTLMGDAACVEKVTLTEAGGEPASIAWKAAAPDKLALTLPLARAAPGPLTLAIESYGEVGPQLAPLEAYAPDSGVKSFDFAAGDAAGVLKGGGLDAVGEVRLAGVVFRPDAAQPAPGELAPGELAMTAADAHAAAALAAGRKLTAEIDLKDGRREKLAVTVAAPRPQVALIEKSVRRPPPPAGAMAIRLEGVSEIPADGVLAFSFRAVRPAALPTELSVEVATADGRASATLTPKSGLTLADAGVGVATLDMGKAFGGAGFGALRFRVIEAGAPSDWVPLGTLVRLPTLKALSCRKGARAGCDLSGDRLFLLAQLSSDPSFAKGAAVEAGFAGDRLTTPRPQGGRLYVKLRDAPDVVNAVEIADPARLALGQKPRGE